MTSGNPDNIGIRRSYKTNRNFRVFKKVIPPLWIKSRFSCDNPLENSAHSEIDESFLGNAGVIRCTDDIQVIKGVACLNDTENAVVTKYPAPTIKKSES